MTAIVREDAEPLPASVPAPFRRIVERLLHKEPSERCDSTRDHQTCRIPGYLHYEFGSILEA
jgi:hypothetical protein